MFMQYKNWLIAALAVVGLLLGWQFGQMRNSGPPVMAEQPSAQVLPDTQWQSLRGDSRSLTEWKGKVLIVNNWATWCEPCRREIPMFMEVRDQYLDQGLELIGLAHDDEESVRLYVDSMGMEYPQLLADPQQGQAWLASLGANGSLPLTLIYDREGQLRAKKLGLMSESELRRAISGLL